MKKFLIVIIAAIVLLIVMRFFYSSFTSYMRLKAAGKKNMPEVSVSTVKEQDITMTFLSPGRVSAKYQVSVLARISGYLEKSYFKEGDYVKKGETLFLIEPLEYQNASDTARANIENIKSRLDYANKQLIRAQELLSQDYIAKSRYDEILSNRDSLRAQLKSAQSSFNDTKRNLSYTQVKSPVDGRIGFINVTVGNYVTPSSGALTTINSTNPMYVIFSLSAGDYNKLSAIDGNSANVRKAELYFQDGSKYDLDGVQDFYDNKIDIKTDTVTMRATFQNPYNRLLQGEFVNVKLYANKSVKLPVVPIIAVQENQEGKYVFLLDKDNMPKIKYIKVQGQNKDNWIVKDGLKAGDRIITEGILKVIPDNPVKIKRETNFE